MNMKYLSLSMPFVFIVLYGSGFVFTKMGLAFASPMAFLILRFFIAFLILFILSLLLKSSWPKTQKEFLHIAFAGTLTVGTFSIGVYLALSYGLSVSLCALIISLQPLLVTLIAQKYLNERINKYIWRGLFIAFFGVFCIVLFKLNTQNLNILSLFCAFVALIGLSFGNIYQKKYCSNMNLFTGGAIGTLSSSLLVIPFLFLEESYIIYNKDFFIALFYMSIGVSIGALSLLYLMIKKNNISKVASLFYLVPVSAVVISYFLLDESIDLLVLFGIGMVLLGLREIHKKQQKTEEIKTVNAKI
ncbi:MAG: DMT family transporter [Campylobacteraceae bacterium]|nr:DMT family transporter [Campylobacteraceae bacterium]